MEYEEEEDEFDKLDHIIHRSGCQAELEASKECHFEYKDWRMCTETTNALKECMMKQQNSRAAKKWCR